MNISSLGGKSAATYLGAYNASKFALNAYSQQLRLELGPQGLHVLLVCPVLWRTARFGRTTPSTCRTSPNRPANRGGGVKTRLIEPEWLARRIVRACQRRDPELVVPGKARLLLPCSNCFPGWETTCSGS